MREIDPKTKAVLIRQQGYMFADITNILKRPKTTIYSWTSTVRLDEVAIKFNNQKTPRI